MSMLPVGFGASGDYTIEESLRFNASQSSYLSWTPASAGNRKTWTWSAWVKRGAIGSRNVIFSAQSTNEHTVRFEGDSIQIFRYQAGVGYTWNLVTSSVYRDPSAWYHIVVAYDTTQATASNRVKLYVNGVQVTSFSTANYPAQNSDYSINGAELHTLGKSAAGATYFDAYLTEVNFIDGQALDASSFGEFDATTGVWKPKGYTGTYGTNGFYLPMKLDNTTEGFNTVIYVGTGSKQKISGVGFSPDLIWMKSRTSAVSHVLIDSVRGVKGALSSNNTAAEYTESTNNGVLSFDTDGFTVGNDGNYTSYNSAGQNIVAWCWDAGSSTVSNTDGSITSSVRANPTYGFSVVTYTGTGANATVGHGLGSEPKFIMFFNRSAVQNKATYHSAISPANFVQLDTTGAQLSATTYAMFGTTPTAPTSSVFYVGNQISTNGSANNLVAYCFSEVSGYSKFGSYTGTGASGNVVTTGFKPAFVMVKRTDAVGDWFIHDTTRSTDGLADDELFANLSNAENKTTPPRATFTDTGFEVTTTGTGWNASGGTYIYMAFKDTREYAFWLDDSGNNNDWQPNGGITTSSTVTDTPTPYLGGGNYAVLNPLAGSTSVAFSNANLKVTSTDADFNASYSSIGVTSGKWYAEISIDYLDTTTNTAEIGVGSYIYPRNSSNMSGNVTGITMVNLDNSSAAYRAVTVDGTTLSGGDSGFSFVNGDVFGIALDADAGQVTFYKNVSFLGATYP